VHLFEPLGAISWLETRRIDHPDPVNGTATFGDDLAVEDGLIVISSQEAPRGRVWVWHHAGMGQTSLLQELLPSSPASPHFGAEISVSGGRIAVSDPGAEGLMGQPGSGAVMIFDRINPTGSFVERARFVAPTQRASDFGRAIDLEGNRLAVSFAIPPVPPAGLVSRAGLAIIDGIVGGPFSIRYVVSEPGDPLAVVGREVALGAGEAVTTTNYLAVGNALRLEPELRRFAADEPTLEVCPGHPNSTGVPGHLEVPACSNARSLPLRASQLPAGSFGLAVLGTRRDMIPVSQGVLCIGDPLRGPIVSANGLGVATMTLDPSGFGFGPGDVILAQFWHRDTPVAANLTGALQLELAP
jgi:hypothetical protein